MFTSDSILVSSTFSAVPLHVHLYDYLTGRVSEGIRVVHWMAAPLKTYAKPLHIKETYWLDTFLSIIQYIRIMCGITVCIITLLYWRNSRCFMYPQNCSIVKERKNNALNKNYVHTSNSTSILLCPHILWPKSISIIKFRCTVITTETIHVNSAPDQTIQRRQFQCGSWRQYRPGRWSQWYSWAQTKIWACHRGKMICWRVEQWR